MQVLVFPLLIMFTILSCKLKGGVPINPDGTVFDLPEGIRAEQSFSLKISNGWSPRLHGVRMGFMLSMVELGENQQKSEMLSRVYGS